MKRLKEWMIDCSADELLKHNSAEHYISYSNGHSHTHFYTHTRKQIQTYKHCGNPIAIALAFCFLLQNIHFQIRRTVRKYITEETYWVCFQLSVTVRCRYVVVFSSDIQKCLLFHFILGQPVEEIIVSGRFFFFTASVHSPWFRCIFKTLWHIFWITGTESELQSIPLSLFPLLFLEKRNVFTIYKFSWTGTLTVS